MPSKLSLTHRVRLAAIAIVTGTWLLLSVSSVLGQQGTTPQRGFEAGGSFALSNIETINTSNGNLMLSFPFKLPAGRGGFSGQLGLHYDSKYFSTYIADYLLNNSNWVKQERLGADTLGGWHYGLGYQLQMVDKLWQRDGDDPIQCDDRFHWQLKIELPDGSIHELIPYGYTDNTHQDGYGWFDVQPGHRATCSCRTADSSGCTSYVISPDPYSTGTISYYSFDGSDLRVDWQTNGAWTLYLGDGTRVVASEFEPAQELIYDRNGNYLELDQVTYNNHPAVKLLDQMGRYVMLEYGSADNQDTIHMFGTGGDELDYQIKWNIINIDKSYQPLQAGGGSNCPSIGSALGDPQTFDGLFVVSEIDLPTQVGGLKYTFAYNAPYYPNTPTSASGWGELNSITLPHTDSDSSPAVVQYQYHNDGQSGLTIQEALHDTVTQKTLTYLQENDCTSCSQITETTGYSISDADGGTATITNPDGGTVTEYHDSFRRAYKVQHPDGTVVERIWNANRPYNFPTMQNCDTQGVNGYDPQRVNSFVKTEFTSIKDASGNLASTAIKDYTYDKNNNVTSVAEYDWVSYGSVHDGNGNLTGAIPGSAKRITNNAYYLATPDASDTSSNDADSYWLSTSASLRNAIATSEVSDGTNTLTRNEFIYDDASTTGNLTQQKSWDSSKGAYSTSLDSSNSISISNTYDSYGNVLMSTDARGIQTTYCYSTGDCAVSGQTANLYPTRIRAAANYSSVTRTTNKEYDFYTGAVTKVVDADNNVTTLMTYDDFGRPTLVKAAEGKSEETRTAMAYSDVSRLVIVRSDLNSVGDSKLVTIQHYDQLGRVRLTRQLEDASTQSATDETTGIKVQTRYLTCSSSNTAQCPNTNSTAAGSYTVVSNPYRAANAASASSEITMGWTRNRTDRTGRIIEVQTFGGTSLPWPWGSSSTTTGTITTAYDANFTTVTDQASKVRRSKSDGLGRLERVDEPDSSGSLGTTGSPNQATSYAYDALGNLTQVTQGSQTPRAFSYTSLSRLSSATNPESGTINYSYDNDGNLSQKVDPRILSGTTHVTTSYDYDELNRVKTRTYNDGTPTVSYGYDTASTYGKGRLASMSSAVAATTYDGYDATGKVLGLSQTIYGQPNRTYAMGYTYDLAGHVTLMSYPSTHTVSYNYDKAGRLADKDSTHLAFTGNLGDGNTTPRTYSQGIVYDAGGRMTQEQFGTTTPIYNKLFYNSRGQLAEIREGVTPNNTDFERGAIVNHYSNYCWGMCSGSSMPDNNGNLLKQEIHIPGQTMKWQQYDYDSLNRLNWVREISNDSELWKQSYVYDRYGNRRVDQNSANTYGDGIPKPYFAVDTANNRLMVPSGYSGTMHYDEAGNLDKDTYSGLGLADSRLYNAENRMTKEMRSPTEETAVYSYDGDGRRVKRKVGTVETWQVYGIGGELLAEYAATGAASSPEKEYGYRNGQLLITTTCGSGYGDPPVLHDNPLVVGETTVQARHITELRTAINTLRTREGMAAYSWTTSATTSDWISAAPIAEMRTALDQVLGPPPLGYRTGLASEQPIRAIHIQELRDRLTAAWSIDIRWLVTDQLGTPRMIFDQTGSLIGTSRHDYLPFGEEIYAGTGGRTAVQGYGLGDGARQRFTSKERDIETGLDYFEARYFSSSQGRFTSPDEFTGGPHEIFDAVLDPTPLLYAEPADPQSLNKYAYCLGNPLRYIDPDGHQTAQTDALIIVTPKTAAVANDIAKGVGKELANIGIGIGNLEADSGIRGTHHIDPYRADNLTQGIAMVVTRDVTLFGGLIGGRANVGGVAIADSETTTAVAGETANASAETRGVDAVAESSNAARREAMRERGIPTSQQPRGQVRSPHGNSYEYEVSGPGGGRTSEVVTNDPRPMSATNRHGPHWEAGRAKSPARRDPTGRLRMQNQGKVRVAY